MMLPVTTSLRLSLEVARAYAEAFLPKSSIVSPEPPAPPNRVPSDQSANSAKAMSTQFYDTQVSTVDYQILFTKRDREAVLASDRVLVTGAMASGGFASWQISLFMQKLNKESNPLSDKDGIPKPTDWTNDEAIELAVKVVPWRNYPRPPDDPILRVIGLKPENLKYLQIDYQVISTFDRKPPRYDEDQVGALREIATAIKNRP